MSTPKRFQLILLAALTFLLAACSSETTITLYENEEWRIKNVSEVDTSLLPEIGVGGDIVPGMGLEIGVDTAAWTNMLMGKSLSDLEGYYRQFGVDFSSQTRSAGNMTVYTLKWEGQGWDTLETVVLTGTQASIVGLGNNQVRFSVNIPVDETELSYFMNNVVHVRGSKIIDSNAHQMRGKRATWNNPQGEIRATLDLAKKFRLSLPWIIGIVVVIIGGVAIVLFLIFRTPSPPSGRGRRRSILAQKRPSRRRLPNRRRPPRRRG
jgi:hypothetical protein